MELNSLYKFFFFETETIKKLKKLIPNCKITYVREFYNKQQKFVNTFIEIRGALSINQYKTLFHNFHNIRSKCKCGKVWFVQDRYYQNIEKYRKFS